MPSTPDLVTRVAADERLVVVTAYDHPGARLAAAAGVDAIMVSDSLGVVVQGRDESEGRRSESCRPRQEGRCRERRPPVTMPLPPVAASRYLCTVAVATLATPLLAAAAPAANHAEEIESAIHASTPVAFAFILAVLVLKVSALVLGYLIVRLGHDTLIRGVTGAIDFGFSGEGLNLKLKAASPGALFVVAGAAIIVWGLAVQKPMKIRFRPATTESHQQAPVVGEAPAATHLRRPLPD